MYGNVINLTKKQFTKDQYKLLNKNLNYIPNPGKPNTKDFNNDKDNFYRRIILRAHFGNNEPAPYLGYKNKKSSWIPKNIHHSVKTFIESVDNDLSSPERDTPAQNDTHYCA